MEKNVIVYSKNGCGPCTLVKNWLTENGVAFEERNISLKEQDREELIDLGYTGVPVILADGQLVANGFNPAKMEEAFGEG